MIEEAIDILSTDNCMIISKSFNTIDYSSPFTNKVYTESVYDIVNGNAQHDIDNINNNIDHCHKFDLESSIIKERCALITPINSVF